MPCMHPDCVAKRRAGFAGCNPRAHSPHGDAEGTWPLHPGKTARDKRSGANRNRLANRLADPGRRPK